jgi:hypothetical protein
LIPFIVLHMIGQSKVNGTGCKPDIIPLLSYI